jgi:uncharacterized protein (TIGR02757 family)
MKDVIICSSMDRLKAILNRFYREYDFKGRIAHDPIEFPHRYKDPGDIEVSGFIASCLAYGRVDLFKAVVARILARMGASPHAFILSFNIKKEAQLFTGIKYRFNETDDIVCLIFLLHTVLRKYSTLENAFMKFHSPSSGNIEKGLSGLMAEFLSCDTSAVYGKNIRPPGLAQFFPSPVNGSACKRSNLFLRWMIRDRDIDLGIWKGVEKNRLVIPLDTHIARISRCLGFTTRKSQDWKTAIEITEALKKLDPEDPLKYDFSLCHHGISGVCRGMKDNECKGCVFKPLTSS